MALKLSRADVFVGQDPHPDIKFSKSELGPGIGSFKWLWWSHPRLVLRNTKLQTASFLKGYYVEWAHFYKQVTAFSFFFLFVSFPWPFYASTYFILFIYLFIFYLWWILSYTEMKQPRVYMCSPSQSPLPPPTPPAPSRFSQCTRSERLSHTAFSLNYNGFSLPLQL